MKVVLSLVLSIFTWNAIAGGDVPWPIASEEEIIVDSLSGIWAGSDEEPLVYNIRVKETGFGMCPYVVAIAEISLFEDRVTTHGVGLHCLNRGMGQVYLLDDTGDIQFSLDLVGLSKTEEFKYNGLGPQLLGLSMYNYPDKKVMFHEIFYKIAN